MKTIPVILLLVAVLMLAGCKDNQKDLYLPETHNDKVFTIIGGGE